MAKFIPIFPLKLGVFPGQYLNLHIFEPRYKQLINDCFDAGKNFAIPAVLNDTLYEYGTELRLAEIVKRYDNGEMDIKTEGVGIVKILEVVREVPDKLYTAAIVTDMPYKPLDTDELNPTLLELIVKLHKYIGTSFNPLEKFKHPLSFDLIPYAAMPLEEQCRLLSVQSEKQRQLILIQHLVKIIPTIDEANKVRQKVQMNGHFRNETSPDIF